MYVQPILSKNDTKITFFKHDICNYFLNSRDIV